MLLTLAQKNNEATVVIDHMRMGVELRPDEIAEVFANLEAQNVAEHQPEAKDVKAVVTGTPTGRIVVLNYLRPGLRGAERVVQYSMPIAQDLYRLICSALIGKFNTYEPIFTQIAYSFRSPAGASTTPKSEMVQAAVSTTDRTTPPRKTKNVNPAYPPEAVKDRLQGEVIMEAMIGADGKVTAVRVIKSTSGVFDAAAMDAVRQWEFTPTLVGGVPTPVRLSVRVAFTPDRQ
ncbi:MAG: energy transducer TonB [Acidobacteria bacterium]|nr:energy transducer TonB [Acidobacteriota bacterium]